MMVTLFLAVITNVHEDLQSFGWSNGYIDVSNEHDVSQCMNSRNAMIPIATAKIILI